MKQCQTWCKGIPYAFLLFMAAAFAGRAFLGFDWSDESMYLALPYRFVLGDRPFLDSWDSHQLWGLLMVPAVKGYLLLFGSMDGAILFFRIAFVLFQGIVAVLAYQIILRLTGRRFPSFVAAVIFFAFTPSSISAFSPMTVSSCFMMLSALLSLVMAGRLSKRLKLCGFLSGLCFAVSSFSYPLFLIALPCYLALSLFLTPDLEKGKNGRAAMALSFLAGCALTWMAVTVYLIAAIGFYPALKGIVSSFALKSFHHLAESTSLFLKDYYHLVFFALLQVTLLFCILLGKISSLPVAANLFQFLVRFFLPVCVFLQTAFLLVQSESDLPAVSKLNQMQACAGFWPLILFALHPSKRSAAYLTVFYLPANLMAWASYVTDGNGITGASFSLNLAVVAAFFMVWECCWGDALDLSALSNLHWQRLSRIAAAAFSLFFVITCAGMRIQAVYRDAPLATLNTQIHLGPAKGIYTTSTSSDKYESIVKFLMDEGENRSAAFSELLPFGYLCLQESPASPTVWRLPLPSEDMEKYLELHLEKRPDILLELKEGYGYGNDGGELTLKEAEALIKGAVIQKESSFAYAYYRK